jgi:peroxiredoxin
MLFNVTFALAWVLAFVQALMILAFMWILGRLKQQYDPTFQPLLTEDGPPLRAYVPEFTFTEFRSGEQRQIWDYLGKTPAVLLFTTGNCPPCREILDSAAYFQNRWVRELRFLLIVRAGAETAAKFAKEYPNFDIVQDTEGTIAEQYGVTRFPFGLMVARTGILWNKGVVNTPQHLEGLVLGRGRPLERVTTHEVPAFPGSREAALSGTAEGNA